MRAEVIAIGDEITTGQRLDTNSQWLSQRLTEMGVAVAFHTTIGDELEDNILALRAAIDRADIVVVTGGLGPTADDLTREALAAATGKELVRDARSLEHLRQLFQSRGRTMPSRNIVQADFPAGSQPIPNPHGTAPGVEMHIAREKPGPCVLFALPGVPAEMFEMWEATVAPRIAQLQPKPCVTRHRRIKCFGVGESKLEEMLPDLIRRDREPRVGITASDATITLRITATEKDEPSCFSAMEPTVATIYQSLGTLVYGEEDDELEDTVTNLLRQQGKTLAVAEWATQGLVGEWLKRATDDTKTLLEGKTLNDRQQIKSLPVGIETFEAEAAVRMAEEIRQSANADLGLAVAAYPPDHAEGNRQICMALALPDRTQKLRFSCAAHPAILRPRTAKQAINAVRLTLLGEKI